MDFPQQHLSLGQKKPLLIKKASPQVPLLPSHGTTMDGYGTSVSIGGKYAVVGSPMESGEDRVNSGAVYVYESYYGMWSLSMKFVSTHEKRGYMFGNTVAVHGMLNFWRKFGHFFAQVPIFL